jgi:hypothetical protein
MSSPRSKKHFMIQTEATVSPLLPHYQVHMLRVVWLSAQLPWAPRTKVGTRLFQLLDITSKGL